MKYFYFMKPGDILYDNEALISENCLFTLIVKNANLTILQYGKHSMNLLIM